MNNIDYPRNPKFGGVKIFNFRIDLIIINILFKILQFNNELVISDESTFKT